MTWFTDMAEMTTKAMALRVESLERLAEIGDHTGCEAASARSFQEGRLDALKRLGLDQIWQPPIAQASDNEIRKRRLDLDDSLRERGTSRPDRDPLLAEPIVRRADGTIAG